MRINSLIMVFLITPLVGFTQNKHISTYKNTYKYLINNELKKYRNVGVSNEIVFIEYSSFIKKESITQIDSLNELDNKIKFKPYFVHNLNRKLGVKKSLYNLLYFSEPYNGFLIVDFVHRRRKIMNPYKKATMFGNLTRYLLKIDGSKIEKISMVEIANN
jgi:hypothetical protein